MRQPSAVLVYFDSRDGHFIAVPCFGEADEDMALTALHLSGLSVRGFFPDVAAQRDLEKRVYDRGFTRAEQEAGHPLPESQRHRRATGARHLSLY